VGIKRNYKDSVFVTYFKDGNNLIDALSAIDGKPYGPDTKIEINTLETALYLGRVNDISFTLDNKLIVLIEHQATQNRNMPLRLLIYISEIYKALTAGEGIYKKQLITIPKPEFIVLYNGNEEYPDKEVMRLSDAFEEADVPDAMELTVRAYNINKGHNAEMLARSKALRDYSEFISLIKANINAGLPLENAVDNAVKYCLRNGIMRDFLSKHGSEVENMLFTEWNWDDALAVSRKEGREEGREEGVEQTMKALRALSEGKSVEEAAGISGLPTETVKRLPIQS
jgi:predicted transposase/invertase (TIGR01784 family)